MDAIFSIINEICTAVTKEDEAGLQHYIAENAVIYYDGTLCTRTEFIKIITSLRFRGFSIDFLKNSEDTDVPYGYTTFFVDAQVYNASNELLRIRYHIDIKWTSKNDTFLIIQASIREKESENAMSRT